MLIVYLISTTKLLIYYKISRINPLCSRIVTNLLNNQTFSQCSNEAGVQTAPVVLYQTRYLFIRIHIFATPMLYIYTVFKNTFVGSNSSIADQILKILSLIENTLKFSCYKLCMSWCLRLRSRFSFLPHISVKSVLFLL